LQSRPFSQLWVRPIPRTPKTPKQITRESHEANYKKQVGGMKRDRKISHMIQRHERHAHHRHHMHR